MGERRFALLMCGLVVAVLSSALVGSAHAQDAANTDPFAASGETIPSGPTRPSRTRPKPQDLSDDYAAPGIPPQYRRTIRPKIRKSRICSIQALAPGRGRLSRTAIRMAWLSRRHRLTAFSIRRSRRWPRMAPIHPSSIRAIGTTCLFPEFGGHARSSLLSDRRPRSDRQQPPDQSPLSARAL